MDTERTRGRARRSPPAPRLLVALAVGFALVAGACGSDDDSSSDDVSTTLEVGSPFEGTTWELTTGGGLAVDLTPAGVTAVFNDGNMSGNTGCNAYGAPYTLDGQDIDIDVDKMTKTAVACEGSAAQVETAYLAILARVASFYVTGPTLTLAESGGTNPLLIYTAMP